MWTMLKLQLGMRHYSGVTANYAWTTSKTTAKVEDYTSGGAGVESREQERKTKEQNKELQI